MKLRSWALRQPAGDVEIEVPAHLHQPVDHRRHRNIQNLHHGHHVGDVLHGAQLDPFLWSLRFGQAGQPHSPLGVFLVKKLEERLGEEGASVAVVRCTCFLARAIATVIRSCLSHELSRRSRRRRAALSHAAKGCPLASLP